MTYTYHTDPSHGWLEVPVSDLMGLGLKPEDFSEYSYRRGEFVFLEEDCDASVFVDAYVQRHGARPQFREVHTDSDHPIRAYDRIK
jgi:hypothetical protein